MRIISGLSSGPYKPETEIFFSKYCSLSDIDGMKFLLEKKSFHVNFTSMSFIALRFEHLRFDEDAFQSSLGELSQTRYSLKAIDENAPNVTHCITAVRHIIRKSTGFNLPHEYIGDFISNMLYNRVAGSRLIPLEDGNMGDLVFFHRRSPAHKIRMITHVGILTDDIGNYFHSSPKGGNVESISHSLMRGTVVACDLAMRRTDPRKYFNENLG